MGFHLLRSMSATLVAFLMVMCATPAGCSAVPDYDSYTAGPPRQSGNHMIETGAAASPTASASSITTAPGCG